MFQVSSFKFQEQGFTLIEATVAASVFAISMTSMVGLYISVQRLNQESRANQAVQQNIRFFTEDLTKLIANGSIDYDLYPSDEVPQPSATDLIMLDKDGAQVRIYRDGDDLLIQKGTGGSAVTSNFIGNDVKVITFLVYVIPEEDPFDGGDDEQPTVTLFVELESNLGTANPTRRAFQTTVATRQYPD